MNEKNAVPFLLRYEEEPTGDSLIDGLDDDYFFEPAAGGMAVRTTFIPWDTCWTLKSPEV